MTPRTQIQNRGIREKRHQQLLETALRLFANEGYHYTTIQRIAKEVGISKGLMYSYFTGKEDLLMKMVEWGMGGVMKLMNPEYNQTLNKEALSEVIKTLFRMLKEYSEFWKLYYSVLLQPDVYALIKPQFHSLQVGFIDMLTVYYQAQGSQDPSARARLLNAVMEGIFLNYIYSPEGFSLDNLEELVIHRFIVESW